MAQPITIAGRKIEIVWNQEASRRFRFRLGLIGGHPAQKDLTNPATAEAAFVKLLWALLPATEIQRFGTPEDLFLALDLDNPDEVQAIFEAVAAIYGEMSPSKEKKTNGGTKRLPESS